MSEQNAAASRTHAGHEVPRAWVRFLAVHAAITAELNAAMLTRHALTLTDYEVLLHLSWAPDGRLSRSDLAGGVLLTHGGVTRLIKGLEEDGLVTSTPGETDRRVTYAKLTAKGRRRLERAARDHAADVERLFTRHFTPSQLRDLASLLDRLPGTKRDQPRRRPTNDAFPAHPPGA